MRAKSASIIRNVIHAHAQCLVARTECRRCCPDSRSDQREKERGRGRITQKKLPLQRPGELPKGVKCVGVLCVDFPVLVDALDFPS